MRTTIAACGFLAATLTCGLVVESRAEYLPAPAHQQAGEHALVIHSQGLDGILVSEKDQVLRDALHMLGDRVAELPGEIPDMAGAPGPLLQMIAEMLLSPMTFRGGMLADPPPDAPPFYAQVSMVAPDAETAAQRIQTIFRMIEEAEGPPPNLRPHDTIDTLQVIDADGAAISFGSMEEGGRPVSVIALNTLDQDAIDLAGYGLPQGVKPAIAFKLDMEQLLPLIEMGLQQTPDGPEIRRQLEMMGVLGEQPPQLTYASGYGPQFVHSVFRYKNYASNQSYAMLVSRNPLTERELRMIPADATFAQVNHSNLGALGDYFIEMMNSMPEQAADFDPQEIFATIEQELGVNLKTDLLDHLGEAAGFYMSDTTGGGGVLSSVAFVQLANADAVQDTLRRLAETFNQAVAADTNGYVEVRNRSLGGHDVMSLSFPGVPIPLEISFAVADGFLFVGATPQALVAGLDQAGSAERSLLDNPSFRAVVDRDQLRNAIDMSFMDTPRLVASGYGVMTLVASAISNGLQSPGSDRDPRLVMPPYHVLADNVKPMVSIAWLEGDDLVYHSKADPSLLVNLCGAAGGFGGGYGGVAVAALGAGALLPAIGKARATATATMSMAQQRQLAMAIHTYVAENDGAAPTSLDQLMQAGYFGPDLLSSPYGPAPDGPDFWMSTRYDKLDLSRYPAREIITYDRAMFASHHEVAVGFYDGHVEILSVPEFLTIIDAEPNNETDFQLPWE